MQWNFAIAVHNMHFCAIVRQGAARSREWIVTCKSSVGALKAGPWLVSIVIIIHVITIAKINIIITNKTITIMIIVIKKIMFFDRGQQIPAPKTCQYVFLKAIKVTKQESYSVKKMSQPCGCSFFWISVICTQYSEIIGNIYITFKFICLGTNEPLMSLIKVVKIITTREKLVCF